MDRPLGPRQPDKRVTAYESIFGRPSVSHHLSQGQSSAQSYSPSPSYPQNQYPYPSPSPQHYPSSSSTPYQRSPRQSIYGPPPPQNQAWSYPNYSYNQPQYPQSTLSPVPNAHLAYPDDSADPNFESFAHQGVAYQAQAYHNSAPAVQQQQGPWGPRPPPPPQQQQQPAYEYEQYQNGAASRSIPHLGVNIDVDNGRLGLDFDDESSPSDTDDSELPWAAAHSRMYHSMRPILHS
jgi:hypothetical protein